MRALTAWPAPGPPTWKRVPVIASSSGPTARTSQSVPPTIAVSVPASAPATPPETGASTKPMPGLAGAVAEPAGGDRVRGGHVDDDRARRELERLEQVGDRRASTTSASPGRLEGRPAGRGAWRARPSRRPLAAPPRRGGPCALARLPERQRLRVDVEDAQREARREAGRHRPAHRAEADEADRAACRQRLSQFRRSPRRRSGTRRRRRGSRSRRSPGGALPGLPRGCSRWRSRRARAAAARPRGSAPPASRC